MNQFIAMKSNTFSFSLVFTFAPFSLNLLELKIFRGGEEHEEEEKKREHVSPFNFVCGVVCLVICCGDGW